MDSIVLLHQRAVDSESADAVRLYFCRDTSGRVTVRRLYLAAGHQYDGRIDPAAAGTGTTGCLQSDARCNTLDTDRSADH